MQIEHSIITRLVEKGRTLACAESCTGGLLAHRLTNVPGASRAFYGGVVAYDNTVKRGVLHVPSSLLTRHGAVSAPVTQAMAERVRRLLGTDYGIGISGIAGPGGGTASKPVGLTFIAVSNGKNSILRECHFRGSRLQIKTRACRAALRILGQMLAET